MPYTFSIVNSATPSSGWNRTNYFDAGSIDIGTSHDKMGTSIPSPFARLSLFQGAFKACGTDLAALRAYSIDTILISECLDLIEFLFQHGSDPKLVIKRWNGQQQIQALRNDHIPEHEKLASVLGDELAQHPELNDLFLFYWYDTTPMSPTMPQELLIGGTSPYTLAFTSPNWNRIRRENGFMFKRLNGNPMFSPDNVEPLLSRDQKFKNLLYGFMQAYGIELATHAGDFYNYLQTMWNADLPHDPLVMAMGGNRASFLSKYTQLLDNSGATVTSAGLPFCFEKMVVTTSDYEIVPKVDRYSTYISRTGATMTVRPPLVLNDNGLPGAKYVGSAVWDATTCIINDAIIRGLELHERMAPGAMGVKYPVLIWSDFLEDKILKLPYSQNSDCFITAFDGRSQYLLPLKRNFFKYFNVEDIEKPAFDGSNRRLVEVTSQGDDVVVTLNIPVRDPNYKNIELSRRYRKGVDIVEASEVTLGFFPFYRHANDALNRYSVLCTSQYTTLSFYKVESIDHPVDAPSVVRTPDLQGIIFQTAYYTIDRQHFDIVEVNYEGTNALVLPKMKLVGINPPTQTYTFAVDFGTSNTYIAHRTTSNTAPVSFEISEEDRQTVYLINHNEITGNMASNIPFWNREFAPLYIGKGRDMGYPARTATCETPTYTSSQPNLFGNISIGFSMLNERGNPSGFRYTTGLKWLLEQHPGDAVHTSRVKNYFLQTLWMLKNESLNNGGGDDFEVRLTFPAAMIDPSSLINLWNQVKNELHLDNCRISPNYSEAIAPYNCLANQIGSSSFLNIDIGGGTNDVFLVVRDASGTHAYHNSSKFAGDDLWGDGTSITNVSSFNNGFTSFVDAQVQATAGSYDQKYMDPLSALKNGVATSSADIMSYFFKHDTVFNTSDKIRGNSYLFSIVIVHYSGILYNVARLINKVGCDIPEKISFTGMGSKYISLISGMPMVIQGLTKILLEKYSGKKAPAGFKVIPYDGDVKEITAKGALTDIVNPNLIIDPTQIERVCDYGFDCDRILTYQDIRSDKNIKQDVLLNFNNFIDTFKSSDLVNFLFQNLHLTIPDSLLTSLKGSADGSFNTVMLDTPGTFDQLNVVETLFFWPLKNALVEASQNTPSTKK